MNQKNILLTINNEHYHVDNVDSDMMLIDFLHDEANLTGTKLSCGAGICRACTVAIQLPGEKTFSAIQACSYPLGALDHAQVITIEGLAGNNGELHPLQTVFLEHFAFQCGYCTPGFLMAGHVLMEEAKRIPSLTEGQLDTLLKKHIGSHICRCTGYTKYYQAFKALLLK